MNISINFDSNNIRPVNPFRFAVRNVKVLDKVYLGVKGDDNISGQFATFYYGRVWAPDIVGYSPLTGSLRYEAYCDDCNKTIFTFVGDTVNPKSNEWWLSEDHHSDMGEVNTITSLAPYGKGSTITRNNGNIIDDGFENNITHTAKYNTSYTDVQEIDSSKHLVFDNNYSTTYLGGSSWSGGGQLGNVLNDSDNPERSNERISW